MKQINCDVSGVGFSINPLNNDYDEAVITSNFGLGESVVGGIIVYNMTSISTNKKENEYAVRYRIHEFLSGEYVYSTNKSYFRIVGNL